jgi:hypothetical protein
MAPTAVRAIRIVSSDYYVAAGSESEVYPKMSGYKVTMKQKTFLDFSVRACFYALQIKYREPILTILRNTVRDFVKAAGPNARREVRFCDSPRKCVHKRRN